MFCQINVEKAHLFGGHFPRDDFPTNTNAAIFGGEDPSFAVGTQLGVKHRLPVPDN